MSEEDIVSRRRFVSVAGAVAAVGVAGCVGEPQDDGDDSDDSGSEELSLQVPTPPQIPDNQYWSFVVRSIDYQNNMLVQLAGGDAPRSDMTRPSPPSAPDEGFWAYMTESHDVQNQAVERLMEDQ